MTPRLANLSGALMTYIIRATGTDGRTESYAVEAESKAAAMVEFLVNGSDHSAAHSNPEADSQTE